MIRLAPTIAAVLFPVAVFAAGEESPTPPTPTETTVECTDGQVWDDASKSCVAPQESSLDDDTLFRAAREFAYAGQPQAAIGALEAMSDPTEDRVLTYLGFANRKLGRQDIAMGYYQAALTRNPDNLLARSYMGQGYVEIGDIALAQAQLREIRTRGGRQTWAEVSLAQAIRSGKGYSY
ncbi:MAG: hypothetical protein AAFR35_03625 [Pseudomonadota bacterium]